MKYNNKIAPKISSRTKAETEKSVNQKENVGVTGDGLKIHVRSTKKPPKCALPPQNRLPKKPTDNRLANTRARARAQRRNGDGDAAILAPSLPSSSPSPLPWRPLLWRSSPLPWPRSPSSPSSSSPYGDGGGGGRGRGSGSAARSRPPRRSRPRSLSRSRSELPCFLVPISNRQDAKRRSFRCESVIPVFLEKFIVEKWITD